MMSCLERCSKYMPLTVVFFIVMLLFCHLTMGVCLANQGRVSQNSYLKYRRAQLAVYEADISRIRSTHAENPAMQAYFRRLDTLDVIATVILDAFTSVQSTAMDDLLDDVVGGDDNSLDATVLNQGANDSPSILSAKELYKKYHAVFSADLKLPSMSENDLVILRRYYNTAIVSAEKYVATNTTIPSLLDNRRRLIEYHLILPFLRTADEQWTVIEVKRLPACITETSSLGVCEEFSFSLNRPLTALSFAEIIAGKAFNTEDACSFLIDKADSFSERLDYSLARACLQASVYLAKKAQNSDQSIESSIALSALYATTGHVSMAAGSLQEIMANFPTAKLWGKAAVLRLVYLNAAKEYDRILVEAPKYIDDLRCVAYRAQIMYTLWVTMRHEGLNESAQAIKHRFLATYSENQLAGDMYLTDAITEISSGNFNEANRILDMIQYRYSRSPAAGKAKLIQKSVGDVSFGQ